MYLFKYICKTNLYTLGLGFIGITINHIKDYACREPTMQIYNFTDVRNNFKSVLDRVSDDADVAVITRRDSEAVVIMAQKHYDSMMETLYLLSSPANASHLMRSLEQLERGEAVERELLDEQDC